MTDRYSIDQCIHQAEEALKYGKEQLEEGMKQEHYNKMNYTDAQLQLEQAYLEVEKMERHASAEQKERLYRTRLQIQQLQNQMITTPH
jgi:hypothetical protein